MIEFNNVTFQYKGNSDGGVFDLSLKIADGEVVLLCGTSGCGKTTVARLINGLIPHYYKGELTGAVTVGGRNITETELYDLAGVVGTVFQNPRSQFFAIDTDGEMTFGAENIGMPPTEILARKNAITREMNIERLLDRSIFGLSGGQKQRTAIASGIASSKPIIIFDEPTSGLDLAHMKQVADQLKRLKDMGKTVLVVTHDNEFILACCDHVVRLENGSAAENCPLY